MPPFLTTGVLIDALLRLKRCGGSHFTVQNSQMAIQIGATVIFAIADIVPSFATLSWVEMDLITLLIGLNCVSFTVLTWTLCSIADLQIKD